nr:MAG TPA: hypothetical protein [Caudoviricetes sp.]
MKTKIIRSNTYCIITSNYVTSQHSICSTRSIIITCNLNIIAITLNYTTAIVVLL